MSLRPVFYILGWILVIMAPAMLIPALAELIYRSGNAAVFILNGFLVLTVGVTCILSCRTHKLLITTRHAFLLTVLAWLVIPLFGSLPLYFSTLGLSFTDAFFEAMSGITTTGATVIVDLENQPRGLLLWRSLLQWLGGVGIVVMALSLLPALGIAGMQLFQIEFFERIEKTMPRTTQISLIISAIYGGITVLCGFAYFWAGMSEFDAINHAMTTVATGGFSTRDQSIGAFNSGAIEGIAVVFMILGSLPFLLYQRFLRGEWMVFVRDSQVLWFLCLLFTGIVLGTVMNAHLQGLSWVASLRLTALNITSIMTGTGYASADFSLWGSFFITLFFFLMFTGGCAGSTTCGLKVFRLQVLFAAVRTQVRRLIEPDGVFINRYSNRPIPDAVVDSVMGFVIVFILTFVILALLLGLLGLDFLTATSGAAAAIANVGPGLGPIIGPGGSYASLSEAAKWVLMAGMLLGRLEIFTVLVLLSPRFWSR